MLQKTIYVFLILGLFQCCFGYDLEGYESLELCEDGDIVSDENGTSGYLSTTGTLVKFYLLTPSNDTIELNSTNLNLVNTSQPTKFIVHGLGSYSDHLWIDKMAYVYHTNGNYNVIATDWSVVSTHDEEYVVSAVDSVGNEIGTFIVELTKINTEYLSDVHLIGSSVGAQVAGAAGQTVAKNGAKVGRITGLDPTKPKNLEVLDKDDAEFVDVIHTSVDVGTVAIGTADFYIVDGDGRPICYNEGNGTVDATSNSTPNGTSDDSCGELLASGLYILTIEDKERYEGVSCYMDMNYAVRQTCDQAHSAFMGEYVSKNATGSYLVAKAAAVGLHSQGNLLLASASALVVWYFCY